MCVITFSFFSAFMYNQGTIFIDYTLYCVHQIIFENFSCSFCISSHNKHGAWDVKKMVLQRLNSFSFLCCSWVSSKKLLEFAKSFNQNRRRITQERLKNENSYENDSPSSFSHINSLQILNFVPYGSLI